MVTPVALQQLQRLLSVAIMESRFRLPQQLLLLLQLRLGRGQGHLLDGDHPLGAHWHLRIDDNDEVIGRVTSGSTGPTVGYPVGIAYVPKAIANPGTTIRLRKGKKVIEAEIVKGPFYRRAK